jgi:hypothetical protein
MALQTVDNAAFDIACAAVPAPFGPVTRVGNVPDTAPNSHIPHQVTSALSVTVYISYQDLTDASRRDKIMFDAHSATVDTNIQGYYLGLATLVLNANLQDLVPVATPALMDDADWTTIVRAFRCIREIVTQPLWETMFETVGEAAGKTTLSLAAADLGGGSLTARITVTSTGDPVLMFWQFGDDDDTTAVTLVDDGDTIDFDYTTHGGADTYTVRCTALGPGGVATTTVSATVA